MVRLATMLTGSEAAGSDAVHEAFIKMHRKWDRIDNHGAYLRRAVVNECNSMHRRRKVEKKHQPQPKPPSLPAEIDETWNAVQALPSRQRTVVVLRFYEDLTVNQIAEVMNVADGTVKSQLHKALASLRKNLSDQLDPTPGSRNPGATNLTTGNGAKEAQS